jgi:hypothetical protein
MQEVVCFQTVSIGTDCFYVSLWMFLDSSRVLCISTVGKIHEVVVRNGI